MTIVASVILLLVWVFNYIIGKGVLYPPAVFSGIWSLNILGLLIAGDTFYPIGLETYLLYIIGVVAFSFGGLFVQMHICKPIAENYRSNPCVNPKIISALLLILLAFFPLYWENSIKGIDITQGAIIFQQIRLKMTELSDQGSSFSGLKNLAVIAQFVAIVAIFEDNGTWKPRVQSVLAVFIAIAYGFVSGTKGNAVILLIQIFFVLSLKKKRIAWRAMAFTVGIAVIIFAGGLLLVNFAYMDISNSSHSEMFALLAKTVQNYWLGGLVAFDRIVKDPSSIASNMPIYRFFLETGRSLGMNVAPPTLYADYTMISPTMDTNVYTIYFTYYKDIGWVGMTLIMSALGGCLTWLYQFAKPNNPIVLILYSQLCVGMIFSFNAEHFLIDLNGNIKLTLFLFCLYGMFQPWKRTGKVYSDA
jgi:oligosaccharide repeat unit polymerase